MDTKFYEVTTFASYVEVGLALWLGLEFGECQLTLIDNARYGILLSVTCYSGLQGCPHKKTESLREHEVAELCLKKHHLYQYSKTMERGSPPPPPSTISPWLRH